MVITSTIGNRVVAMSGTWVQIPPSPPRRNGLCSIPFFFAEKSVICSVIPLFFAKGRVHVGYSVASVFNEKWFIKMQVRRKNI